MQVVQPHAVNSVVQLERVLVILYYSTAAALRNGSESLLERGALVMVVCDRRLIAIGSVLGECNEAQGNLQDRQMGCSACTIMTTLHQQH